MHDGGFLIPIAFFAMIAAIVLVPRYYRNKERQEIQATVRAAIEKGQAMPADLVEAISRDVRPAASPQRDLRAGIIWLGVAAGFAAFGYALSWVHQEAGHATPVFLGIAAFPGFVGLALIALGLLGLSGPKK
ncbi:asparagine N-glycosylation enzyme membrane subunit Stt3 [Caulobacter ginsengisoli]|uniref:Asparagine N-glycosylation enzyme membrane subunit Stt3 n=1 Tax=Caulobacter ginsengisoli TaxID=400775 RepID=A0ABU0IPT7_9CAUL|nr:DUF6249 domain-containing protein [Caulobacter ginsengisoli]MDQ0464019.1 asparagine N-glycosylation enzyme membrane subunit Stt3 [Caulobacter ginsengisoli]